MNIKDWNGGRIAVYWIVSAALVLCAYNVWKDPPFYRMQYNPVAVVVANTAILLWGVALIVPFAMAIATLRWFKYGLDWRRRHRRAS